MVVARLHIPPSHPQIQFISTGTGGLVQPGTSCLDIGARFDGRSECSVCLKTFRDNHTLKQGRDSMHLKNITEMIIKIITRRLLKFYNKKSRIRLLIHTV